MSELCGSKLKWCVQTILRGDHWHYCQFLAFCNAWTDSNSCREPPAELNQVVNGNWTALAPLLLGWLAGLAFVQPIWIHCVSSLKCLVLTRPICFSIFCGPLELYGFNNLARRRWSRKSWAANWLRPRLEPQQARGTDEREFESYKLIGYLYAVGLVNFCQVSDTQSWQPTCTLKWKPNLKMGLSETTDFSWFLVWFGPVSRLDPMLTSNYFSLRTSKFCLSNPQEFWWRVWTQIERDL